MDKYENDYHNCSNERLAQLLREVALKNNGDDREIIYQAAARIEARMFEPRIPFNHEAFG